MNSEGSILADWAGHSESAVALAIGLNRHWLVSAGEDRRIRLWRRDNDSFDEFMTIATEPLIPKSIHLSEDERWLSVLFQDDRAVRRFDLDAIRDMVQKCGAKW